MRHIKHEYGSLDWFRLAHRHVMDQAIALRHLRSSGDFIESLMDRALSGNQVVRSALFRAFIIEYCKPFTKNEGGSIYHFSSIRQFDGVNSSAHESIIRLRNKLIAHQDSEYFDAAITVAGPQADFCDGYPPTLFAVDVVFVGLFLHSVSDQSVLSKFHAHIHACIRAVENIFNDVAEQFRECVSLNNDVYRSFMNDAPQKIESDIVETNTGIAQLAIPDYKFEMKGPPISDRGGYYYQSFTLRKIRFGNIKAKNARGEIIEMQFSQDPQS